jgi:hypothetical protein
VAGFFRRSAERGEQLLGFAPLALVTLTGDPERKLFDRGQRSAVAGEARRLDRVPEQRDRLVRMPTSERFTGLLDAFAHDLSIPSRVPGKSMDSFDVGAGFVKWTANSDISRQSGLPRIRSRGEGSVAAVDLNLVPARNRMTSDRRRVPEQRSV